MDYNKALRIISKAWGRQSGYCFFPWISGDAQSREERIQSYHEGPAFLWPKDRAKIAEHMAAHADDDLYWCPSLFEKPRRQTELAMDEHALWADLDAIDPREIEDYPPTIAWETSPGRYQALWIIASGDMQGASWRGGENHRLTVHLDADPSGWDTTQLLRIPGWKNHKIEYQAEYGEAPRGKLLWSDGRRWFPDEFGELPTVEAVGHEVQTLLESQIDSIDRLEVWGRVRLEVSKEVRELVAAKEVAGNRSDKLWQIERDLADAGCNVAEIVAVVRETVWNKFAGRADELKRLTAEAGKAIDAIPAERQNQLEEEAEVKPTPSLLVDLIRNVTPPKWLIKDILSEGACGFIAGQPKQFKSWVGLDMALSVAMGVEFLNYFPVMRPGPVLYIQEEDPLPTLKQRFEKIWPSKQADKMVLSPEGVVWLPAQDLPKAPPLMGYVGEGFTISSPGWQAWLDETLAAGIDGQPYVLVVMDPLMMIAGEVEENRAQQMTEKVFKPIKQLARKHGCAIQIVHHMRKSDPNKPQRGGQLMLGSVANHAWAEDSLYLRTGRGGDLIVEAESKFAPGGSFKVGRLRNRQWTPEVIDNRLNLDNDDSEHHDPVPTAKSERASSAGRSHSKPAREAAALRGLKELGAGHHRTTLIAQAAGVTYQTTSKQLGRLAAEGKVTKIAPGVWSSID